MNRPEKPYAGFPLSAHQNGQWYKKINQKPYYFGRWQDDPKGDLALKEFNSRLPGINDGTDHLRHITAAVGQMSVGQLGKAYLAQRKIDVTSGELALRTIGDLLNEIELFTQWIKADTAVAALKPEHFTAYNNRLVTERKLRARSRKRVQAYIKAMFRWGASNGLCSLPSFGSGFQAPSTTKNSIRKEKARAGIEDYSERIVTGGELDMLLATAQQNLRALILLGINCGLGPADLGRLRWKNIDLKNGVMIYPRHKTGAARKAYLWKRTRNALNALLLLRHTKAAFSKDGGEALVFITRKRQPYYREVEIFEDRIIDGKLEKVLIGVNVTNSVTGTFGNHAKAMGLKGVTFYRLRHTTKTLGKRAKDRDALNLVMGHQTNSVEAGYDHETIPFDRVKRVALAVYRGLWPNPKLKDTQHTSPQMKIAGGDDVAEAA